MTGKLPYEFMMMQPLEVARAREELKQLALISYGTHAAALNPENAEVLLNNIRSEQFWDVLLSNSVCFVCKNENKPVGMAFLIPSGNPWRFFKADWCYIRMVGVLPEHEGKGIGKKLTSMCIDYAKLLNEKIITLHTSEYMNPARHIYESLGFTILKEIEPQWGKRYWLYKLDLK